MTKNSQKTPKRFTLVYTRFTGGVNTLSLGITSLRCQSLQVYTCFRKRGHTTVDFFQKNFLGVNYVNFGCKTLVSLG